MKKWFLLLITTTQISLVNAASSASSSHDTLYEQNPKLVRVKTLFYSGYMQGIITLKKLQDILIEHTLALEYYISAHFPSSEPCSLCPKYITTKKGSVVFFNTNKMKTVLPSNTYTGCVIFEYHLRDSLSFMIMKFTNTPTSQFVLDAWMSELQKQQESLQEAFKNQNYPKVVALLFEHYEKNRDTQGCIKALLPYVEQGDVFAMFELSRHFMQDYLESKNTNHLKSALQWFSRASIREEQDLSCHRKNNETLFCNSLSHIYYQLLTAYYNSSLFKASFEHYFKENLEWVKKMFESSINTIPSPEWLYYWSDNALLGSDNTCYLQPKENWNSLRLQCLSNDNLMPKIFFSMTHASAILEDHGSHPSV